MASLFSDLGHELVTALTPGFLVALGAPPIALGLIEGVSGIGQNLANLWSGVRADETKNRIPYLVIGYAATALKALYGLVSFWPWMVLIRTVGWVGRGMRGPMRDTLISETVPRSAYGKALGFREGMDTLGGMAGPLLGAWLLSRIGYRNLFWWSAAPSLLSLLMVLWFVRDNRSQPMHHIGRIATMKPARIHYPQAFRRLLAADAVFSIGNVAPSFFILAAATSLAAKLGAIEASMIGILLYTWYNFVYAIVAFIAGNAADRFSARPVLLVGYGALVLALVGFALLPPTIAAYAVLFTLAGISTGTQESVQKTYVSLALPTSIRGRGLGLHASVMGWGTLVSGVLVGGLWSFGGHMMSLAFSFAALAVLVSVVMISSMVPDQSA